MKLNKRMLPFVVKRQFSKLFARPSKCCSPSFSMVCKLTKFKKNLSAKIDFDINWNTTTMKMFFSLKNFYLWLSIFSSCIYQCFSISVEFLYSKKFIHLSSRVFTALKPRSVRQNAIYICAVALQMIIMAGGKAFCHHESKRESLI